MVDKALTDPQFGRLLGDYDLAAISASEATIYGVWPDLTLAFVNQGWTRFAVRNNAEPTFHAKWSIGRNIVDAIALPLRPFFEENFARCLADKRPWEHCYECSSAELFRKFHMMTFPLGNADGLLVVNSLIQETPHTGTPCPPIESLYRNEYGMVTQCSHCRRIRRSGMEHTWDWVPDWVKAYPSDTSHGLCEPCLGFYYSPHRGAGTFAESFRTF
jgi:hypothetical protein